MIKYKKIVWFSLGFLVLTSCIFSAGSFPYAEIYSINMDEDSFIKKVEQFKEDNPRFKPPEHLSLDDKRKSHWYYFYFYFKEEKKLVLTWCRADGKKTKFAFVSVGKQGDWQRINKDFSRSENKRLIEVFEKRIYSRILN